MFQVFSRNNDVNGNPFRLILVYGSEGQVIEAYEARSSSPNIVYQLNKKYSQLPTFHLQPSEYNQAKKYYKDVLKYDY